MFGSRMIKPDLNGGRLLDGREGGEEGRANKSACKGMLNEAVLKCAAVSQRNAGGEEEKREREREKGEKRHRLNARLPVWMGGDPEG